MQRVRYLVSRRQAGLASAVSAASALAGAPLCRRPPRKAPRVCGPLLRMTRPGQPDECSYKASSLG